MKQLRNDSGFSGDGGSGTEKKKEGSITRVKSEIEQSEFADGLIVRNEAESLGF